MEKRFTIILTVLIIAISPVFSQTGTLKGQVLDKETSQTIAFANIILEIGGTHQAGAVSDIDGNYTIKGIPPGKYKLLVSLVGYKPLQVNNIVVTSDKITFYNIVLVASVTLLEAVEIVDYKVPLISADKTSTGGSVTSQAIYAMPGHGISSLARNVGGEISMKGKRKGVRGSRAAGSIVYVDGIRIPQTQGSMQEQEFNTESFEEYVENGFKQVWHDPVSTFSVDVDKASYTLVRRFLEQSEMPDPGAVRIEEMVNYFEYDYPKAEGDLPIGVHSEIGPCPWNPDVELLMISLQGKCIDTKETPPSNLVFLIDVSGSMSADNKLPLVKNSLRFLVDKLRPDDLVSIVVYAGSAGLILEPTSSKHKQDIMLAIDHLSAGGSTAGGQGIDLAYRVAKNNFIEGGNNRVILCTDGDFNVGVSSDAGLVKLIEEKRRENVFLSILGFGMGNYKDAKMEKLSNAGNGNYAYIYDMDDARMVFGKELMGTLYTIAKDVKLQIEFNPAIVSSYRLVGYENRILEDEDFNDDRKDAGDMGSGHRVTAFYEIGRTVHSQPQASVDPLRYQQHSVLPSPELACLKIRYKDPEAEESKLMEHVIMPESIGQPGEDFCLAAGVAEFGMLLRESEYMETASYDHVIATLHDIDGYKDNKELATLIKLVKRAKSLQ